jgi:uncharacterized protein
MKPFKCSNCGLCCGPVPVNEIELKRIQKKLKRMPRTKIEKLKNQTRTPFTCMFRDEERNQCAIYNVRPEVCRMFGFYDGMVCPENPEHATIGREEGTKRLSKGGKQIGILSLSITWDNIMKI